MAKKEFQVRHGLRAGSTLVIDDQGNWVGNTILETKGGTAQTTYAAGDILYASGVDTLAKLTAGGNGRVLTLTGGVPTWELPTGAGSPGSYIENIVGGDGITVTTGSPDVTVAVDSTVARLAGSPIIFNADSFAINETLRIYDSGGTDWLDMSHNGSNFTSAFNQTTNWYINGLINDVIINDADLVVEQTGGGQSILTLGGPTVRGSNSSDGKLLMYGENAGTKYAIAFNCTSANMQFTGDTTGGATAITNFRFNDLDVDVYTGRQFRIRGVSNTPTATFVHDDTDFNTSFASTTDWSIAALTGNLWLRDGAGLKISDSGDTDFAIFTHDGTDFNTALTNTTDWNIFGITGNLVFGSPIIFQSTTAAAGGLLARNTLTGTGLERVLTTSDLDTGSPLGLPNIVGGDGITVTTGSPQFTVAVDSTVARDGDNISGFVNDANYLKTIGSPFLDIRGGNGITVAFGSPRVTITNSDPNVDQNLWLNIAGDVGGPVAANTTTDTLTIAGGTNIRTNIAGDTITVNMTGSPFTSGGNGDIGSPFLDVRGGDGITVTAGSPRLSIAVDGTVIRTTSSLNDLGDVLAGSPTVGAVLYNDGTNWLKLSKGANGQVLTMGSPLLPIWKAQASVSGSGDSVFAGDGISIASGSPLTNKTISVDGTVFRTTNVLNDISDVVAGSPTIGAVLYNDGTNWIKLARGTNRQVLQLGSPLLPSWRTIDVSDLTGSPVALSNIVGGDGITVTTGSPQFTVAVDATVSRAGDNISDFVNDANYLKTIGSPFLDIRGGAGITVTFGSPRVTITNSDPNVDQNLWLNIAGDVGGPVAANTTTDTLTIAGGTNIRTNIAGDTITVNMTGSPFTSSGGSVGSPLLTIRGGDGIDVTFGSPKVTVAVDSTVARMGVGSPPTANVGTFRIVAGSPIAYVDFSHDGTDLNTTFSNTDQWNVTGTMAQFSSTVAAGSPTGDYGLLVTDTRSIAAGDNTALLKLNGTYTGSNQVRTINGIDITVNSSLANFGGSMISTTANISGTQSFATYTDYNITNDKFNGSAKIYDGVFEQTGVPTTSRNVTHMHIQSTYPATSSANYNHRLYSVYSDLIAPTDWNTATNALTTKHYGIYSRVESFASDNIDSYALYLDNANAHATHYGLYQAQAGVVNYFAGDVGFGINTPGQAVDVSGTLRIRDGGDTDYADFSHDGTDFNTAFTNTTDWNITGLTSIQAGTADADFDAITATSLVLDTTPLAETSGGTGTATYTTGDILYASATNTLSKLAAGTNGQVLAMGSPLLPKWTTGTGQPDQNLWLNIAGDVGGPVAANTTTDTLTIAGGTNIRTNIAGDTVTVNMTGSPFVDLDTVTNVVGGDGITVTTGSPQVSVAVDSTVVRDGDNISTLVNDANYLKTIGSPFLDIRGGTGITIAFGSPRVTITNSDPNVDQNLWLNIASDSGGPVAANTTTDTLTFTGGVGISTSISGDVVTITATGSPLVANSLQEVTDVGATTTNAVTITNATSSTTDTTGALIVTGGIGVAENVNVGGTLELWDSSNVDSASFSHDGTDFNTAFTTTTDWNITGANINFADQTRFYFESRAMPTVVDDVVQIGVLNVNAGGSVVKLDVSVSDSGFSVAKSYIVAINYAETANVWEELVAISDGGAYSGNNYVVDINVNNSAASFRIRRTAGATAGTASCTLQVTTDNTTYSWVPGIGSPQITSVTAPTAFYAATGITVYDDTVDIVHNTNLVNGSTLTIYDGGDTDYALFSHDGTDFNTTFANTGRWNIGTEVTIGEGTAGTNVSLTVAAGFNQPIARFENVAGNGGFITIASGNAAVNESVGIHYELGSPPSAQAFTGYDDTINEFKISGGWTSNPWLSASGAGVKIYGNNTTTEYLSFDHNGTDFNIVGGSVVDVNITSGITAVNLPEITLTTTLDETYGGTGQTTFTTGDILYASGADVLAKLAVGSNTDVLTLAGGVPSWATPVSAPNSFGFVTGDTGSVPANKTSDTVQLTGGTGITTSVTGSPAVIVITNDSPNVDQNLWLTVAGDSGSTAANITTDTLTIAGGTSITTAMSGDTLTITNDAPNVTQSLWDEFRADTGNAIAGGATEKLTVAGGTGITTAIAGSPITLTITNDSPNVDQNLWLTVAGDSGSTAANITTDTLTIAGGTGITTAMSGDTLTITQDTITLGTNTAGDFVGTITGGVGIDSTGATTGEDTDHTLSVDLGEVTAVVFDPAVDFMPIIDGGITGTTQKDAWSDIATLIAGTNITASAGVLSVAAPGDPDQNLWLNINADSGGPVAANTTTDTLTFGGGTGIVTAISGDTVAFTLDLSELGVTVPVTGDWLAFDDAGSSSKALFSSVPLSIFSNDLTTITVADEAADATCFVGFYTAATGVLQPKTNAGLIFDSVAQDLTVGGAITGTTKSFLIKHPSKPGKKLRHGSLEGPEHAVYVRGHLSGSRLIELPDYWTDLINPNSITATLTPVGKYQELYVQKIENNIVYVSGNNSQEVDCFYTIYAERIDINKLVVEE